MANNMVIKQGDSTDIYEIEIEGLTDYTGYRADVAVLNSKTKGVIIGPYSIGPADNKISVALYPSQTALLQPGMYIVVCEVIKEIDEVVMFRKEFSWTLQITESLINN